MSLMFSMRRHRPSLFHMLRHGVKRLRYFDPHHRVFFKKKSDSPQAGYPGSRVLLRIQRLPYGRGFFSETECKYLLFAIDSYSYELFGMIYPDNSMDAIIRFISQMKEESAYPIQTLVCGHGIFQYENMKYYHLVRFCRKQGIRLKYDAESCERDQQMLSVIYESLNGFYSTPPPDIDPKRALQRYLNAYNWVHPNPSLGKLTPGEKLITYFFPDRLIAQG